MSILRSGTSGARKALMKAVKRENTAPELAVRRHLHAGGIRYSLHRPDLPGRPDMVLPRRRTVIFVHGCFWHGHHCAHGSVRSRTNTPFWDAKIAANRERDRRKAAQLRAAGWMVETIWECQCEDRRHLARLLARLKCR